MAYEELLAQRIRAALTGRKDIAEKKMSEASRFWLAVICVAASSVAI
jgi:hypothetical protein